jgi:hypothetical protein
VGLAIFSAPNHFSFQASTLSCFKRPRLKQRTPLQASTLETLNPIHPLLTSKKHRETLRPLRLKKITRQQANSQQFSL